MIEDDDGALWLNTACGLVRIHKTGICLPGSPTRVAK